VAAAVARRVTWPLACGVWLSKRTAGLLSIARLYAKMNHTAGAVRAFKQYIAIMDQAEVGTRLARQKTWSGIASLTGLRGCATCSWLLRAQADEDLAEACMYVAKHCVNNRDYATASTYLARAQQAPGTSVRRERSHYGQTNSATLIRP